MPPRCHTTCATSREHECPPPVHSTSSISSSTILSRSELPTTRNPAAVSKQPFPGLASVGALALFDTQPRHTRSTGKTTSNCTATWHKLRYHDTCICCFPVANETEPNGNESLKSVHKSRITNVCTVLVCAVQKVHVHSKLTVKLPVHLTALLVISSQQAYDTRRLAERGIHGHINR